MTRLRVIFVFLIQILRPTLQDIYLHNPRGSNNRQSERSRARANANRLFDSQNNNRGGYNVGVDALTYVEGSKLQLEWTLQHACGAGSGVHCQVVVQYACDEQIRDGKITSTIPTAEREESKFGRHESPSYYKLCTKTKRNGGLFPADQKLKGSSARFTRQNPNGQRRGLECPEERDYYPYWRSSPWSDVAVLTNDVSRCEEYRKASGDKWECEVAGWKDLREGQLPVDKKGCEEFVGKNGGRGSWKRIAASPSPPLVCRETEFSRDNHLGDVRGGQPMTFNWTVPSAKLMRGNCVLRVRYNVSTGDYDGWKGDYADVDAQVARASGFEDDLEKGRKRGFKLKNNPVVKIFDDLDLDLQLAVNTAQFGRVFQDRSHVFKVVSKKRANVPDDAVVHNVNVRGRRGNIVQVYPAVEYDFVPNTLMLPVGHYIHVQWTGSDTTPAGDGQGKQSTDRSNMVLQRRADFEPVVDNVTIAGRWGVNYPAGLDDSVSLFDLPRRSRQDLALVGVSKPGERLDDASAYFNLQPQKLTRPGVFHFFSTRNNDFSNRNQKGRLMVVPGDVAGDAIGSAGGLVRLRTAEVVVDAGAFDDVHRIQAQVLTETEFDRKIAKSRRNLVYDALSSFLVVTPEAVLAKESGDDGGMRIFMNVDERASGKELKILSSRTDDLTLWDTLPFRRHPNDTVEFSSVGGGVFYVGDAGSHGGNKVGVVLGVVASLAFFAGLGFYAWKQKRSS